MPRKSTGPLHQEPQRMAANKAGEGGQAAKQCSRKVLGPSVKVHQTLW